MRPARHQGVLSSYMKSDGTLAELLYRPGGGAAHPPSEELLKDHSYYIKMAGREVFKAACSRWPTPATRVATRRPLRRDLDLLIPHQANIRIIEATAKHAEVRWTRLRQRGPVRQHLGGLDRHRLGRGGEDRAAPAGDDRHVRRLRAGFTWRAWS